MRCKRAPHRIKNDRREKMIKIDAVCQLKKREFDSVTTESKDYVGKYEMKRYVTVAVPRNKIIHISSDFGPHHDRDTVDAN